MGRLHALGCSSFLDAFNIGMLAWGASSCWVNAPCCCTLQDWEEGDGDYVAPELLQAGGEPSERADIFSLGASLYECATGALGPAGPCPGVGTATALLVCLCEYLAGCRPAVSFLRFLCLHTPWLRPAHCSQATSCRAQKDGERAARRQLTCRTAPLPLCRCCEQCCRPTQPCAPQRSRSSMWWPRSSLPLQQQQPRP